jgi:glycine cleavage system H lipoate-binding protein/ABC-type phosphate transport system substrate-binding protein
MKRIKQFNRNTMKYKIKSALGLLILFCSSISFCAATPATETIASGDTLKILSSPALLPLVNTWAGKFSEMNPPAKVSVSSASDLINSGGKSLRIISEMKSDMAASGFGWSLIIGHNAVVPVINSANPLLNKLMTRGVTASEFAKIFSGGEKKLWSDIIPGGNDAYIHVYLTEGADIKGSLADFTGAAPENTSGISFVRSDEIVSLVEKDINSIGFCKLADIRNATRNELNGKIVLLPIDRNGNGRLDSFEKIYGNPDELTRGIWIGKYPSSLCGSIFAVSSEKPTAIDQLAFLNWVLTDGSQYMSSNGYVSLAAIERESGLTALAGQPIGAIGEVRSAGSTAFLLILSSIIVLITLIVLVVKRAAKTRVSEPVRISTVSSAFNENSITAPNGLLFDKSHTWTIMERDGLVRFGVDDFVQRVTGIITGIRLKEPGEFVRRGEKILSIVRDGKQIDLYSPVSGTIRSFNTDLNIDASIINSSPYTDGWVYLIEPKNWIREIQLMFMADRYRQWLSEEFTRLRSFLSTITRENSTCTQVIMQDGGELTENVLADLEPEVWEDFQTRFIDVSR